jgi:hypothetical protein
MGMRFPQRRPPRSHRLIHPSFASGTPKRSSAGPAPLRENFQAIRLTIASRDRTHRVCVAPQVSRRRRAGELANRWLPALASVENTRFGKQPLQSGLHHCRPIKSFGKFLPGTGRHAEVWLIGKHLLGLNARTLKNKIGDVHTAHLRYRADQMIFARRCAEVDSLRAL